MTGDLVRAMRACPQPIIAAVEGVCAGAGAILAMASDIRLAAPDAKTAFLFTRVGLSAARTWAPARSCRGSSATAAPPSCCSPAAHERRGRSRLGLLEPSCRRRARRSASPRAAARERPVARPRSDQAQLDAEWNVSIEQALEHGSAGPGAVHGDQRLQARLRGFCGQAASRCSRAIDERPSFLSWPFFEARHRELRGQLEQWCAATI